ncbi:hypothetical protein PRIPAC_84613, partial [Pristionchus pacificus]
MLPAVASYVSIASEMVNAAKEVCVTELLSQFADTIVDDLRYTYGIEYSVPTDKYLLNKEIYAFLVEPKKNQLEIYEGIRDNHQDGVKFAVFTNVLKATSFSSITST